MFRKPKIKMPSPALVISCISLFVALGGVGYAAIVLPANSVGTKQLRPAAVKTADIGLSAVTGAKIKDGSVSGADVHEASLEQVPSALHAAQAGTAGSASALGGVAASAFLQDGHAAGGALSGTYPHPSLATGAVGTAAVNDNSLTGTDVNEATLAQVPSSAIANRVYASGTVNHDATLSNAENISSSSKAVSGGTPMTGIYCVALPVGVTARSAMVAPLYDSIIDADTIATVFPNSPLVHCPNGTDVIVTTWDASLGTFQNATFNIWIIR